MPVLLHDFPEDTEDIPQSVRELSQLIYRPLPASLGRVEASTLCSIAQAQLKTASLQQYNVDGGNEDREPLHGVLNLVLMTSAAMAACVQIAMNGGERRRMDLFTFPLFRTLARVCHEECFVNGSVPFIWPKDFSDEHGVATMLISFGADKSVLRLQEAQECTQSAASDDATVVEDADDATSECPSKNNQRAQCHRAANDDDDDDDDVNFEGETTRDDDTDDATEQNTEDEDVSQPDSEDTETDDDSDSEGDSEDDTSEESFQWYANAGRQLCNPKYLQQIRDRLAGRVPQEEEPWLDLPLYTQIFTGQRAWPHIYFPVICVADSSNIVAHVASVAYQRRVWGIELPVVGLEVCSIGSGVRAYIGWLDPLDDDGILVNVSVHLTKARRSQRIQPTVHIIKPAVDVRGLTSQAAAAHGVFDLSHAHSALLFAQFFLALRHQFSKLWSSISVQRISKLEWRSDHNSASWTADIEEWVLGINKAKDTSATP
ncbi:hypothetical protein EWM64_g1999 [Hericium alpestre]|uniref:Uncharacterized protein n=1 Tax=Hericium alpestre TaxID=135208 RepID=A0A4Z0A8U9_9AGAM|nr:hypothetical protein EWM64_g1999 [Hericium alpestre]